MLTSVKRMRNGYINIRESRFQIKNITKDKDNFLVINGSFY